MPSANDLRKGMAIKYNNDVCVVLDMHTARPETSALSSRPPCAA